MPDSATIHTWDRPERPYVLVDVKAFPKTLRMASSFEYVDADEHKISWVNDPESAFVVSSNAARKVMAVSVTRGELADQPYMLIPYDVAARLFTLEEEIRSLSGEITGYRSLIQEATLPVDERTEDVPENAKLTLEVDSMEPHEGVGAAAYFSLDPQFVVVEKALFEALAAEDAPLAPGYQQFLKAVGRRK